MPTRLVLALALFCAPTPTLSLPTPATDADVTAEVAAATKTYSLWSTAKRFFGFRQHLRSLLVIAFLVPFSEAHCPFHRLDQRAYI